MKRLNLDGQRFGHLVVQERAPARNAGMRRCVCDCGNVVEVTTGSLRSGGTTSCGCVRAVRLKSGVVHRSHGQTGTPTHRSWLSMITRCTIRGTTGWRRYGGRGIRVCKRWLGRGGFERFIVDMGPRPIGHTLDRKRVNGNYTPKNCRWATNREQANNTSRNRRLTLDGETLTVTEWSRRTSIRRYTIIARIETGWDVRRALTQPVDHRKGRKAA